MGRRSSLTPAMQARIVDALNAGSYLDTAATYAGISKAQMYRWLARGRAEQERLDLEPDVPTDDKEKPYVEFVEAVESARATSEVRSLALIQSSAQNGTWQAAAWFLERSYPQKYGRWSRHEVSGANGKPVEVTVTAEDLEAKIRTIVDSEKSD
jgi:transposase